MAPARKRPHTTRFTPAAAADLDEAFAYTSEQNRCAASEILDRLRSAIERLSDFLELGIPLSPEDFELLAPGIRFLVVEPYLVFYRDVVVLRILHSRRDFLGELFE
jgi:toxin ParE1/3/4